MSAILIRNSTIINEGQSFKGDVLIKGDLIESVRDPGVIEVPHDAHVIDASGLILIPGVIDDQVHFRQPGLTHKGDIWSESRAAVAGGITSYMDMPNTIPPTTTNALLNEKFRLGADLSFANYSFYIGATNNNLDELLNADPARVCGIKVFMGSSTGDMLVDNENTLNEIFSRAALPLPAIANRKRSYERILKSSEKNTGKIYR